MNVLRVTLWTIGVISATGVFAEDDNSTPTTALDLSSSSNDFVSGSPTNDSTLPEEGTPLVTPASNVTGPSLPPEDEIEPDVMNHNVDPALVPLNQRSSNDDDDEEDEDDDPLPTSITSQSIYSGCFETKDCHGAPPNCFKSKSCSALVTFRKDKSKKKLRFEMMVKFPPKETFDSAYVAVGFSKDSAMGGDLVVECVNYKGILYDVFKSRNRRRGNVRIPKSRCSAGLSDCAVASDDSDHVLYCAFRHPSVFSHSHRVDGDLRMDLSTQKVHLLLAGGHTVYEDGLGKHSQVYLRSRYPIDFMARRQPTYSPLWAHLHGHLSVLVFLVLMPSSLFIVRYLRRTRSGVSCCGKRWWFVAHVTLNVVSYLLGALGVAAVFLQRSEVENRIWPETRGGKSHAVLGVFVGVFFTVQIVSGWFRPRRSLENKRREVFSKTHGALGILTYFLGVITLAYSHNVRMPCYIPWVVLGHLIWQLACVVVMITKGHKVDKPKQEEGTTETTEPLQESEPVVVIPPPGEDPPGEKRRLIILLVTVLGNLLIGILVSILYEVNPCECNEGDCLIID